MPKTKRPSPADGRASSAADGVELREARRRLLAPISVGLWGAASVEVLAALCAVVPFVLIAELAGELLAPEHRPALLIMLGACAFGVLAIRAVLSYLAIVWSHRLDMDYQLHLRQLLAAKLARLPLGWFTDRNSGTVKKLLQDDVQALHYLIAHARLDLVAAVTVPAASFAYLLVVDWRLTLVLLVPFVLCLVPLGILTARNDAGAIREYEAWTTKFEQAIIESIDGAQVQRIFGQVGRAPAKYRESIDRMRQLNLSLMGSSTHLITAAGILLSPVFTLLTVIVAGIALASAGLIEPITILPFVLLGVGIGAKVMNITTAHQNVKRGTEAALRVFGVLELDELAEVRPAEVSGSQPTPDAVIEYRDVDFAYVHGNPVLTDVSFALRKGTITAVVGRSGSGKSTLAALLPRFHDPSAGQILMNGRDLRTIEPAELYRHVGFVLQRVQLLKSTVRENLAMARPEASDDDIVRAARTARIHDRILALPRGYDSVVGEDALLSGGEAQRLSIARALLGDTPVVVLDEATAFVDPESESAIQDALSALLVGRTTLVIAHRLHTITDVDNILVLEAGRLVESGTHAELAARPGTYRRLWELNERALTGVHAGPAVSEAGA